ncbi:MAG: hypothetical protein K0S46_2214 [Moraxellaceae bacterium]|jgi:hypothetical protein|nr:hypothetical protein [Moraxellaceae bacterium]
MAALTVRNLIKMPADEREALKLQHRRELEAREQVLARVSEQRERYRESNRWLVGALVVAFVPACAGADIAARWIINLWA